MLSIATPHHTQDIYYHTYLQDQTPSLQLQQLQPHLHHYHHHHQQRLPLLPPPHHPVHHTSLSLPPLPPLVPLPSQAAQPPQAYQAFSSEEPYVFCHYRPATTMPHRVDSPPRTTFPMQDTAAVRQALELARESPDGAQDPTIRKILEAAVTGLWGKVQDSPDSYVMDRDEFAVFNYFQHRFRGDSVATAARKRYWDNLRA